MSNTRFVDVNTRVLPDPNIMEWLQANRVDPAKVPADQTMLVTDEHIEFLEFVTTKSGALTIAYNENGVPYRPKNKRMVPLLSDPETHGVEVHRNV